MPAHCSVCLNSGMALMDWPKPLATTSTRVAALALAPKMIGNAALMPKRVLLLSTNRLVGPGVMDATKAKSRNGSKDENGTLRIPQDDGDGPIIGNGASGVWNV